MSGATPTSIPPAPVSPAFSINRAIFRAAVSVGAAGVIVKLVATLKEVAVASVYGRSDAMDAFLAAAAEVHKLTLVTRNVSDFEPLGGKLFNPWA